MTNKNYKILHVEDSPEHAKLVGEFLMLKGDYSIYWVNCIQDFWDIVGKKEFDLIIMDYRLPDGTGLDLLEQLHQSEFDIPVIMVTGQGDEKIAVKALRFGASDYIVKTPDYFMGLHSLIQKVIGESQLKKVILQSYQKIRYQALLLKNIQDALIVWNDKGNITYWNSAAEKLFSRTAEEQLGKNVFEFYFSLFDDKPDQNEIESSVDEERERRYQREDDRDIWISSKIMELRETSVKDRNIGFIDVVRDISQRKQVEEKLEMANARLMETSRLKTIGELSTGIAHRIFNPLTSIIANTQLLERSLCDDEQTKQIVKDIEKAGWQAQAIVSKLMSYSSPMLHELSRTSIRDSINDAFELIGGYLLSDNISIDIQIDEDLPEILGNQRQLIDLWVNLFVASRNSMTREQSYNIWIRANRSQDMLHIEVEDNGHKEQNLDLETLFEPDFIGEGEDRMFGLEYSICREIVRQHKGRITAVLDQENFIIKIDMPYLVD